MQAGPARMVLTFLVAVFLVLPALGCGKPPILVHQYLLEYPAPPLKGVPLDAGLKVERFAVAQAYNTTAMVYQPSAFKQETYRYHRWRVSPGYLATDYLARDLRDAGLFKAVFTCETGEKPRFVLEGGVEDFQEVDAPEGWNAVLALVVTLIDTSRETMPTKVVFQKNYRVAEPMLERTPKGLAEGMSRALGKASAEIIADVYQAARQRLVTEKKK